jgi:hypothetical protein
VKTVGILATIAGSVGIAYWAFDHFYPITMTSDFVAGAVLVGVGFVAMVVAGVIAQEEDYRR